MTEGGESAFSNRARTGRARQYPAKFCEISGLLPTQDASTLNLTEENFLQESTRLDGSTRYGHDEAPTSAIYEAWHPLRKAVILADGGLCCVRRQPQRRDAVCNVLRW